MAMENGSVCVGFSDAHYGHPRNMARPGKGRETSEFFSVTPGAVVIKLFALVIYPLI
jgi:allantoicase